MLRYDFIPVLLPKFERELIAPRGILANNTNVTSYTLCAWWNLTCFESFLTLTSNCGLDAKWFLFTLSGCLNLFAKRNNISSWKAWELCASRSSLSDTQPNLKKNLFVYITPIIIWFSENLSDCVCFRSCIFYRACVDIPRGTELLVWYNDSYTSFFGIPLQCIAQDENCKTLLSFVDVSDVNVTMRSECCICKTDLALISAIWEWSRLRCCRHHVWVCVLSPLPWVSFVHFVFVFLWFCLWFSVSVTNLFLFTSSPVFCSVSV